MAANAFKISANIKIHNVKTVHYATYRSIEALWQMRGVNISANIKRNVFLLTLILAVLKLRFMKY